jgi:uncharacterized membrane protein
MIPGTVVSDLRTVGLLTLGLILLLATTGCSGPTTDNVGTTLRKAWIARHSQMASPYEDVGNAEERNEFIDEYVAIKNIQYHNFVTSLRRGGSFANLAADGSRLILDSLAATSGGAAAKAGLAAASAGITGFTGTVKKDVLFDQALPAFVAKMEELRANKLADITRKKRLSFKEYTRSEAFNDVEEYGANGTFDAALHALSVQTAQSAALAAGSLAVAKREIAPASVSLRGSSAAIASGGSSFARRRAVVTRVSLRGAGGGSRSQHGSQRLIDRMNQGTPQMPASDGTVNFEDLLLGEMDKLKNITTEERASIYRVVADSIQPKEGAQPAANRDAIYSYFRKASPEEQAKMQKTLTDQINIYLPRENPPRSQIPQSNPPSLLPPLGSIDDPVKKNLKGSNKKK